MLIFPRALRQFAILILAAAPVFCCAGQARAQSGVDMLLKPWDWQGKQTADLEAGAAKTNTSDSAKGTETSLVRTDTTGRLYLEGLPFQAGWKAHFLHIGTQDRPAVPQTLHDMGFSLATSLTPNQPAEAFGHLWDIAAEGGIGQAATGFDDTHGMYGTGTLTAGTDIGTGRLLLGASYDGNRSLLPDVPLPGFEYRNHIGDKKKPVFSYRIGVPRMGFAWQPDDAWRVEVNADITSLGSALVEYEMPDPRWHLFGAYAPYRIRAHMDNDDNHRRLFFSSNTLEAGFRFTPRAGIHLVAALGYAFDQKLERGWDSQKLTTVREFDAAPTMRCEFRWNF